MRISIISLSSAKRRRALPFGLLRLHRHPVHPLNVEQVHPGLPLFGVQQFGLTIQQLLNLLLQFVAHLERRRQHMRAFAWSCTWRMVWFDALRTGAGVLGLGGFDHHLLAEQVFEVWSRARDGDVLAHGQAPAIIRLACRWTRR